MRKQLSTKSSKTISLAVEQWVKIVMEHIKWKQLNKQRQIHSG